VQLGLTSAADRAGKDARWRRRGYSDLLFSAWNLADPNCLSALAQAADLGAIYIGYY